MKESCLSCSLLGSCRQVDEIKLYQGYCCDKWEEVDTEAKTAARNQIIRRFGLTGAAALIRIRQVVKEEK